ncbi:protein-methionine-sulfoxide reductase heme-binding subunit MsrQ [Chelativorans alearense]|uniref:protein-methionine-sulfoxide reductase heme-binding subunit MsrQ n=1 Tax=Chelativorans alearense TaxID=2681495 RepID=UPI0013CF6A9E|nr:protein-methionine-sulfoxide reductase heme-binding subunit MsrQ [Chelativorans alearense]
MLHRTDVAKKLRPSPAVRFRLLRAALYWVGFAPAVWVFYLGFTNQLGANPVRTLEQELGIWTLRFLIATLTVTPLRNLTGISLLRYRRTLGLLTFYYALLHFATYMLIDYRLDLQAITADIVKRPYITFGMLALAILVPLAVTSNDRMVRRLGSTWTKLHRWVYLAATAAAVHYLLVVKSWPLEPIVYFAIIAVLLAYRLGKHLRRRRRRRPAAA